MMHVADHWSPARLDVEEVLVGLARVVDRAERVVAVVVGAGGRQGVVDVVLQPVGHPLPHRRLQRVVRRPLRVVYVAGLTQAWVRPEAGDAIRLVVGPGHPEMIAARADVAGLGNDSRRERTLNADGEDLS